MVENTCNKGEYWLASSVKTSEGDTGVTKIQIKPDISLSELFDKENVFLTKEEALEKHQQNFEQRLQSIKKNFVTKEDVMNGILSVGTTLPDNFSFRKALWDRAIELGILY